MKKMIKSYLPYAAILFALYMLVPLIFIDGSSAASYGSFAYNLIFPGVTIICAVHHAWKNGLDFFFAALSPVLFLPSMLIYKPDNAIIFLVIYLVSGILGSFIGDIVFSEQRKKEEQERKQNETVAIQMKEKENLHIEEDEEDAKKNNDKKDKGKKTE